MLHSGFAGHTNLKMEGCRRLPTVGLSWAFSSATAVLKPDSHRRPWGTDVSIEPHPVNRGGMDRHAGGPPAPMKSKGRVTG